MDTKEFNLQRRMALYNIKAKNSGFNDFFGKDQKREKQLDIEHEKLSIVLQHEGIKEKIMKPGEIKNEKSVYDRNRDNESKRRI